MRYYGGSFHLVYPEVVEKVCPEEYKVLMAAFEDTALSTKQVAHMLAGLLEESEDLDQQADLREIGALVQAVVDKFYEKTQLRIGFEAAESDWELEDGHVDLDEGYYWEVFNAYIPNPAVEALKHSVYTEHYVYYG